MNLLQTLEAEQMKAVRAKPLPDFRAGDTLKVNVKVVEVSYDEKAKAEKRRERLQAFEGVCIARQGGGLNEAFTVRKISYGEGVERVFPGLFAAGRQRRRGAQGPRASREALLPARPPG